MWLVRHLSRSVCGWREVGRPASWLGIPLGGEWCRPLWKTGKGISKLQSVVPSKQPNMHYLFQCFDYSMNSFILLSNSNLIMKIIFVEFGLPELL